MFTPRREPDPVPRTAPAGAPPYAPPGWPREVRPPGIAGWEHSAMAWLLDQCPPEYRGYPALRRHPVLLARFARLHVEGCQAAVDRGLSEARGSLRDVATREEIGEAIGVWEREKARLLGVRRAAGLVEDAVQGRRYVEGMS